MLISHFFIWLFLFKVAVNGFIKLIFLDFCVHIFPSNSEIMSRKGSNLNSVVCRKDGVNKKWRENMNTFFKLDLFGGEKVNAWVNVDDFRKEKTFFTNCAHNRISKIWFWVFLMVLKILKKIAKIEENWVWFSASLIQKHKIAFLYIFKVRW